MHNIFNSLENGEERKMAAVAEMAASSPSSWCIWVAKLEKKGDYNEKSQF